MGGERWLVVNPRSGGGVWQQRLALAARGRGVSVRALDRNEDAGEVARRLVDGGAKILGAAGGDGTIRSVAEVAVEHDLPLVCVPSGTRNHFADDMRIDDTRPLRSLAAYDGVERRVDVGEVNGVLFLNNASIGAYARMVRDPGYRHRRMRVARHYSRRALGGGKHRVVLDVDVPADVPAPERSIGILVANNAYAPHNAPGQAMRPRVDQGELWTYVLAPPRRGRSVVSYGLRTAIAAARGQFFGAVWSAREFEIGAAAPGVVVPVAIDGEGRKMELPLRFRSRPGALRLLVGEQPGTVTRTVSLHW